MARVQTVYIEEGNAVRKLNPEVEYEEYLERRRQEEERRQRDIRRAKIHRQKRKKVASVYATMAIGSVAIMKGNTVNILQT